MRIDEEEKADKRAQKAARDKKRYAKQNLQNNRFNKSKSNVKPAVKYYFDDDAEVENDAFAEDARREKQRLKAERARLRAEVKKRRYKAAHSALYKVLLRPNLMLSLSKKVGQTRIFVGGKSAVRALAAISEICRVEDVKTTDEGLSFFVPAKVCDKIIALLDNLCYDYKIIDNRGIAPLAFRALARVGLTVGVALGAVMFALYPNFVTRVSVAGVGGRAIDSALIADVSDILNSCGVREGRWLGRLDTKELQNRILALDGVSFAGVERRGTHVNVTVAAELAPERFLGVKGSVVVASKVAYVTRIVVEGGTATVKYGDVVRPGDTLIDGYVMYGDDRLDVEARGVVYGKVYYSSTEFFADKVRVATSTRRKTITKFGYAGKQPKPPKDPFGDSVVRVSAEALGFLFPIYVYRYTFESVQYAEEAETSTDEQLEDRVFSKLLAAIESPVGVTNRYTKIRRADGGRYVTVTLETEEIISQ